MDNKISLQVGERQFITTKDTLVGESAYFQALLSGRWANPFDHEHFIDSDPELFTEILRYLRSGNFPLYFDPASGTYDYAKYAALLGEAQYFGISKLEAWIQKQCYLDAVTIHYSIEQVRDTESVPLGGHYVTLPADQRLDFSYLSRAKRVYLCPRRIAVHRDHPESCGRQCLNARGESEREYEDTYEVKAIVVKTQQLFHPEVCLGVHAEPEEDDQTTVDICE
ncbi:hypothetical protein F5Y09DRAFT_62410 [Xylaria sp. FL1042]|nr:hypothetical protein F5Y09DRAFT_62410 [Xylaria sp. FL1042]